METSKKIKLLKKNFRLLPKLFYNLSREKTNFDYRLLNGRSLGPKHVIFEITARCNLRCKFCWLWGESGIGKQYAKEELSTDEIKNIIDNLPSTCYLIYISGGEPFIREDLLEIINHIKSKGFLCDITSNGILIRDEINEIIGSGLDQINISIDGTKKTHDAIRGKGNFEKTIGNIRKLVEQKKLRGSETPIIKMNTTISPTNYKDLVPILKLALDLQVDRITFQQFWFTSKKLANAHKEMMKNIFNIDCKGIFGYVNEKINEIDEKILESQLKKLREIAKKSNIYLKFWPDLSKKGTSFSDYKNLNKIINKGCLYPWYSATIKPNGDVVPCPDYYIPEYVIGNLKENNLSELWNSQRFIFFRKKLKECGIFPGCRRCCALV